MKRWLGAVGAVLGLLVLCAIGLHLGLGWAIRSGWLLERINAAQSNVTIRMFEPPQWSWTRLEGEDLQVLIHDAGVETSMHFDHYDLDWRPWRLLAKHFDATRVEVDGLRFRLRRTRTIRELCLRGEGLPPIEDRPDPPGFGRVPCEFQKAKIPARRLPPRPDRLYRISLGDVRAKHIREVWIEAFRWQGDAQLQGRWFFHPTVSTELEVERLRLLKGGIRSAGGTIVDEVSGDVKGRIAPWIFTEKLWPNLSTTSSLSVQKAEVGAFVAAATSLKPLNSPALPMLSGTTTGSVGVQLVGGRLDRARLDLELDRWSIGFGGRRAGGRGRIELEMKGNGEASEVEQARLQLKDVWTQRPPQEVEAHDAEVAVWAEDGRLDPIGQTLELALEVRADSMAPLLGLMSSGLPKLALRLTTGSQAEARASADLRVEPKNATLDRFELHAPKLDVKGKLRIHEGQTEGRVHVKSGVLGFDVELD